MKAQFAVVEVILSIILLSAAITVVANSVYTTSQLNEGLKTGYGDAIYDFSLLIKYNKSVSDCFFGPDTTCKQLTLSSVKDIYGLEYAGFSYNGSTTSIGTYSSCSKSIQLCFPAVKENKSTVACIYLCGD